MPKVAHAGEQHGHAVFVARRDRMQKLVGEWETRLNVTPDGQPARLLETLILSSSREDESK